MCFSQTTENSSKSSSRSSRDIDFTDTEDFLYKTVSPDGLGYLMRFTNNKSLLHVQGSPYQMGYQHGYLCASNVSRMASMEYFMVIFNMVFDFAGNIVEDLEKIAKDTIIETFKDIIPEETINQIFEDAKQFSIDLFFKLLHFICKLNEHYVPQEFRDEMRGVAEGATAAGYETSYENVLFLNMGMDALFSLVFPLATILLAIDAIDGTIDFHMCNGFVATGDGTDGATTIMGRYFMYPDDVFREYALLIEQDPDDGHAFISTSAPGFVGVTAAMSSQGIGIGMQVCNALDCTPGRTGMGVILTARKVVQYADELSDAVNMIRFSKRGTSWIYIIGDGRGLETGGVALEVSAHYCFARYTDYERPWYIPEIYSQIENEDGLVVATNHFISTEMNVLSISISVVAVFGGSIGRYERLVEDTLESYGEINFTKCRDLIAPEWKIWQNNEHSMATVDASISCWDLTNLKTMALFGYCKDEWVYHELTIE